MAALHPPPCDIAFPDLRQREEPGRSRTHIKKHLLPAAARHAVSRSKIWRYARHLIETAAHAAHGKFKKKEKKEQKADGASPYVNRIGIFSTGAHVARDAYPAAAAEGEEQLQVLRPSSADEMQASPPHDLVATPPTTSLMQRRATTEGGRAVSWRRVRTDNAAATDGLLHGRQGLVAAAVPRPGGDRSPIILLFGGFSVDGGSGHHHDPSSAIIAFDPLRSGWESVAEETAKGEAELECGPARRAHHTVCATNGLLYFFGGVPTSDETRLAPNELDIFNAETNTWSREPMQGYPPSARKHHAAEVVGSQMYVFGGVDSDGTLCPPDMHILDLASKMCIMAYAEGPEPDSRMGHTCTLVGHKLYIIGGKGHDGRHIESIHILDTAALVWEKVEVGHTPILAFHSAAVVDDHTIAVFGGEAPDGQPQPDHYLLNTEKLEWSLPRVSGVLPSGRSHHAWAMANGRLYLFGGASPDSGGAVPLNDVFALTPHENEAEQGYNLVSGEQSLIYLSPTEEIEDEEEVVVNQAEEEEVEVVERRSAANGHNGFKQEEVEEEEEVVVKASTTATTTTTTERWRERQRIEGTMIEVRVINTKAQEEEETVVSPSNRPKSPEVVRHSSNHHQQQRDKKASGERRRVSKKASDLEHRGGQHKKHQSGEERSPPRPTLSTSSGSPQSDRKHAIIERLEENQRQFRSDLLIDIRSSASAGRAAEIAALQPPPQPVQKASKKKDRAPGEEKPHQPGRRKSFGALVSRLSDLRPRTTRHARADSSASSSMLAVDDEGGSGGRNRSKSRSQEVLRTSAATLDDFTAAQPGEASSSTSSSSFSSSSPATPTTSDESREKSEEKKKRRARSKSQDLKSPAKKKNKTTKKAQRTKSSSSVSRSKHAKSEEKSEGSSKRESKSSSSKKERKKGSSPTSPAKNDNDGSSSSRSKKKVPSAPFPFASSTSAPQLSKAQRSPRDAMMLGVRFLSDTSHSLSRSRSLIEPVSTLDSPPLDAEPPLLQGWLTKKDNKSGEWKMRWCRLLSCPAAIQFYKDEATPLGSIPLVGALLRVNRVDVKKGLRSDLAWSVASPGEPESTFVAKSAKQKRKWVEAIRQVSEAAEEWNGDRAAAAQCLAAEIADIDRQMAELAQLKARKAHHHRLLSDEADGDQHPTNADGEGEEDMSSSSTTTTTGSSSLDPFGFVTMTSQDIRLALAAGRQQMKKEDEAQKSSESIEREETRRRSPKEEEEGAEEAEEVVEGSEEWRQCMDMSVRDLVRELIRYRRQLAGGGLPPASPPQPPKGS